MLVKHSVIHACKYVNFYRDLINDLYTGYMNLNLVFSIACEYQLVTIGNITVLDVIISLFFDLHTSKVLAPFIVVHAITTDQPTQRKMSTTVLSVCIWNTGNPVFRRFHNLHSGINP